MNKKHIAIVTMAILFYMVLVWFFHLNTCLFKNITGLPCPGCGLTRAGTHLIQLEFLEAFHDHLLIIPALIILLLVILKKTKFLSNKIWIVISAVFLGYYVIRLFIYFPNVAPLDFDQNGLIPTLIKWIK